MPHSTCWDGKANPANSRRSVPCRSITRNSSDRGDLFPPLAGKTFIDRWGSKTAAQLIARFQETVDSFDFEGKDKEFTVNITAYVLQVNGARAGTRPLTRTTDSVVNSITR